MKGESIVFFLNLRETEPLSRGEYGGCLHDLAAVSLPTDYKLTEFGELRPYAGERGRPQWELTIGGVDKYLLRGR